MKDVLNYEYIQKPENRGMIKAYEEQKKLSAVSKKSAQMETHGMAFGFRVLEMRPEDNFSDISV